MNHWWFKRWGRLPYNLSLTMVKYGCLLKLIYHQAYRVECNIEVRLGFGIILINLNGDLCILPKKKKEGKTSFLFLTFSKDFNFVPNFFFF